MKQIKSEYVLGGIAAIVLIIAIYKYSTDKNLLQMGMHNNSVLSPAPINEPEQDHIMPSINNMPINNPHDLLPTDSAGQWAEMNPLGSPILSGTNLLNPQQIVGINTQGSSLRNSNLQIRSEPPNPRMNTNCPWNVSTIDSDQYRRPLEIGSGA
jgi:hypothetical protein